MAWQEVVALVRLDITILTAEESCLSADCSWHGKYQYLRPFLECREVRAGDLECVKLPLFPCKPVESVTLSSKDIPRRRGY